ncbi:MAG: DUF4421 domain-containing protein [Prevotella sp.]
MKKRVCTCILLLLFSLLSYGGNSDTTMVASDTLTTLQNQQVRVKKNTVFRRIGKVFTKIFKSFNEIDTNYIEPQHYNYTVMLQNTHTYETYKLKSKSGQSIMFSPKSAVKIGPYVGWRWVFLGYTFDINHISNDKMKKEIELSLYSSLFGIDLYYRKTGSDYRIKAADLGDGIDRYALKDVPFSGLSVGIKGFDIYYIFNHKKFSYPAAFSQSTCQKRSCGSFLAGIGCTSHDIELDYDKLKTVIQNNMPAGHEVELDEGLMFNKVRYSSYSLSGGYAYNWVFARNFLFAASISVSMSYKKSEGERAYKADFFLKDFNFNDLNIDGVGRFGLVWNNTKYYVGTSTILHSYNYKKSQFSTNNVFGSFNLYVGVNIGRKR